MFCTFPCLLDHLLSLIPFFDLLADVSHLGLHLCPYFEFFTSSARLGVNKHTRDQKAQETRPEKDPM